MTLAAIPSPSINGFDVGPLRIHFYALCIIAGIVVAAWITARRLRARGVNPDSVYDIAMWCVPFGIVGGRTYHVLSHWPDYFGEGKDLMKVFYVWEGGLAIMGAITLGAVGAWLGCRKAGIRLSAFADAAAPGVLVAQGIGRLGNWFNQELFGGPTTLPWGLEIDATNPNFPGGLPAGTLFHPTFLYEMIWNILGALVIVALDRRFRFRRGSAFWLYVMIYNAGRYVIEHMRTDPAVVLNFFGVDDRINSWAALFLFLIGVVGFVVCRRRAATVTSANGVSLEDDSPFTDLVRAEAAGSVLGHEPAHRKAAKDGAEDAVEAPSEGPEKPDISRDSDDDATAGARVPKHGGSHSAAESE